MGVAASVSSCTRYVTGSKMHDGGFKEPQSIDPSAEWQEAAPRIDKEVNERSQRSGDRGA